MRSVSRWQSGAFQPWTRRSTRTFKRPFSDVRSTPTNSSTSDSSNADVTALNQKSKKSWSPSENIFSGIQPTGVPHLGNYLGALRQWKSLQDEKATPENKTRRNHRLLFCIVDLHALTGWPGRERLAQLKRESFASLLAIGLDPYLSVIFMQSDVSYHAELMWYLSTIASTGYLSRMTQWKSKLDLPENASLNDDETTAKLKLGLFSYPVLQAADILLYETTLVPVGEDQQQHIEFARTLARGFNSTYAKDASKPPLVVPRARISPAKRIMSLRDPTQKMSKSHPDPKSRILITDTPEEIHSKVKSAVTDSEEGISYDVAQRPGVSNLVEILKHITRNPQTCEELAKEHESLSMRAFKELVADEVVKGLGDTRGKFEMYMDPKNDQLEKAIQMGRKKATSMAGVTMQNIRDVLGVRTINH